jgi:homoserine kinase type II
MEVIPKEELSALLTGFDLGKIKKIRPLSASGNITFKIETAKGNYFFRLCPSGPQWRPRNEIQAEIELLAHLKKHHFPVTEPIPNKNGKEIISWKNHHGYLRKFVDGKEKLRPTFQEIKEFGRMFGTFHTLIENYKTPHKRNHRWDLEQTKKYFEEDKKVILKSDFKNKKEFIQNVERELSKLHFPKNLPSGTIHEDLGKRHVLWHQNKIAAVIDFDRSYYGKLILDFGQAARGWCFENKWQTWSIENFNALLEGYESKRKLTPLEKKYLRDAIMFAILERSISFSLRYTKTHNPKDETFAWDSVTKLIPMIKKNATLVF